MGERITRRNVLAGAGALLGASFVNVSPLRAAAAARKADPFRYCLNAALVMGYKLDILKQIELASQAGYDAIEPWVQDVRAFKDGGGSLADLKKRIADAGLTVESAIGFTAWIADNDDERTKGVEAMKRDMELMAQIGAKRIAAPPVGATRGAKLDLFVAAERYRAILEIGDKIGIIPQIEVWGHSANLSRLGESMFVVIESGHPKACLLPDFYHIYRGGSSFEGLRQLSPQAVQVFHMNDYPDIPRDRIADKDRIFPGDGVAPLPDLVRMLYDNGVRPVWSIELFNRDYWNQYDAPTICQMGLAKMKAVTAKALA
ncbi:MAG: sugar phosphate isomerase/epimerase [Sedimentisphaerales bacterium]|nr:sugar phosphate isomerase/epimerase [Sedimentisphaerales bacterium]